MKKIATLAVAGLLGLGLATAADAQQRPMGASGSSGSSMSQSSQSSMPAKSSTAKKSTSAKKSSSGTDVKAVQTALNKNGAGLKVDGKMGKGTRAALKSYQKSNGLPETGRVDNATKAKLGV